MLAGIAGADLVYHGVATPPGAMNAWVVTIETTAVFHTTNFGTNWESQEILTIRDFFDVFFLDESRGWICGRVGVIYYTPDAGDTWMRQNLGGPKFATRIRFVDENHGWAAGGEAIMLYTANGGSTWEMNFFPNPPYPSDTVDFQGLYMEDANTGWLVAGRFPEGDTFAYGQGYITRTTDGGTNWELQRRDTLYDFYDVAFPSSGTGVVVGGDDRTMDAVILRTTDNGDNWTEVAAPAEAKFLRALKFVDQDLGFACGRNGTIIRTTDAGLTWTKQPVSVDTTLFDIDFADSLHGMVAGNSVVLYTTDGGGTWIRGLGGVSERPSSGFPTAALAVERNPSYGSVSFQVARTAHAGDLSIHDCLGRPVRLLRSDGGGRFEWDGLTEDGSQVSSGIYLARLEAGGDPETARFVYVSGR